MLQRRLDQRCRFARVGLRLVEPLPDGAVEGPILAAFALRRGKNHQAVPVPLAIGEGDEALVAGLGVPAQTVGSGGANGGQVEQALALSALFPARRQKGGGGQLHRVTDDDELLSTDDCAERLLWSQARSLVENDQIEAAQRGRQTGGDEVGAGQDARHEGRQGASRPLKDLADRQPRGIGRGEPLKQAQFRARAERSLGDSCGHRPPVDLPGNLSASLLFDPLIERDILAASFVILHPVEPFEEGMLAVGLAEEAFEIDRPDRGGEVPGGDLAGLDRGDERGKAEVEQGLAGPAPPQPERELVPGSKRPLRALADPPQVELAAGRPLARKPAPLLQLGQLGEAGLGLAITDEIGPDRRDQRAQSAPPVVDRRRQEPLLQRDGNGRLLSDLADQVGGGPPAKQLGGNGRGPLPGQPECAQVGGDRPLQFKQAPPILERSKQGPDRLGEVAIARLLQIIEDHLDLKGELAHLLGKVGQIGGRLLLERQWQARQRLDQAFEMALELDRLLPCPHPLERAQLRGGQAQERRRDLDCSGAANPQGCPGLFPPFNQGEQLLEWGLDPHEEPAEGLAVLPILHEVDQRVVVVEKLSIVPCQALSRRPPRRSGHDPPIVPGPPVAARGKPEQLQLGTTACVSLDLVEGGRQRQIEPFSELGRHRPQRVGLVAGPRQRCPEAGLFEPSGAQRQRRERDAGAEEQAPQDDLCRRQIEGEWLAEVLGEVVEEPHRAVEIFGEAAQPASAGPQLPDRLLVKIHPSDLPTRVDEVLELAVLQIGPLFEEGAEGSRPLLVVATAGLEPGERRAPARREEVRQKGPIDGRGYVGDLPVQAQQVGDLLLGRLEGDAVNHPKEIDLTLDPQRRGGNGGEGLPELPLFLERHRLVLDPLPGMGTGVGALRHLGQILPVEIRCLSDRLHLFRCQPCGLWQLDHARELEGEGALLGQPLPLADQLGHGQPGGPARLGEDAAQLRQLPLKPVAAGAQHRQVCRGMPRTAPGQALPNPAAQLLWGAHDPPILSPFPSRGVPQLEAEVAQARLSQLPAHRREGLRRRGDQ